MVQTSSIILAATIAFFAVGPSLALPTERHPISTRENIDDLEARGGWGSLFGKVATKEVQHAVKKQAKHEVKKGAENRVNQAVQNVGNSNGNPPNQDKPSFKSRMKSFFFGSRDIEELAARDIDSNEFEVYGRELDEMD